MSDYNSGLPVRTQADGTDERIHVKIVDGTVSPAVNQTKVDSDNNLHVESHGNDPAGVDRVLATSEQGEARINGVYDAVNNTKPSKVGVTTVTRTSSAGDSNQTQRVTSVSGASNVVAMDMSLHDASGNAYTNSNPLPVSLEESAGTEVNDYNTASALAVSGTSNHDYTITNAKNFKLRKIWATASGKMKITVQISPDGSSFNTKFVAFNSTADPNISIDLHSSLAISDLGTGTAKIRIIRQNNDNQAQDVYSTISGIEE
jgi:hypothetical protein